MTKRGEAARKVEVVEEVVDKEDDGCKIGGRKTKKRDIMRWVYANEKAKHTDRWGKRRRRREGRITFGSLVVLVDLVVSVVYLLSGREKKKRIKRALKKKNKENAGSTY